MNTDELVIISEKLLSIIDLWHLLLASSLSVNTKERIEEYLLISLEFVHNDLLKILEDEIK